ncbi:unnamed protein product, partial [Porites lobata]
MHEQIKEHDRDIRLSRAQTSAVSEHANKTRVIRSGTKVKKGIHVRLHPNNINRDSGIEIPEAWMPTIRQQDNR